MDEKLRCHKSMIWLLNHAVTSAMSYPGSCGQHGAHLGPGGPRWAQRWPHESCYQGRWTTSKSKHGWSITSHRKPWEINIRECPYLRQAIFLKKLPTDTKNANTECVICYTVLIIAWALIVSASHALKHRNHSTLYNTEFVNRNTLWLNSFENPYCH